MTGTQLLLEREAGLPIKGFLSYVDKDHAFSFRPADPQAIRDLLSEDGRSSLVFGTVQVEVAVRDGRCLFAWGYSPRQGWLHADLSAVPPMEGGICRVVGELEADVSRRASPGASHVLFDPAVDRAAVIVKGASADWATEIAEGVALLGTESGSPVGVLFELVGGDWGSVDPA